MIAAFLPLVLLSFATVQLEGELWAFPGTILMFLTFTAFCGIYFFLPRLLWRMSPEVAADDLPQLQVRAQWAVVLWICALQVFCAPALWLTPAIHQALPQVWPMLLSVSLYLFFMLLVSRLFHAAFAEVFQTGQSPEEFFRARLTLPILFFPPILLWMCLEDLLLGSVVFSLLGEVWMLALAPIFFIALYLLSPYLFNLAWRAEPLLDRTLHHEILLLSERCRTPIAGIKIWDTFKEPLPNAAVAGLADRYRFVYITQFLLEILNGKEVTAVVAHELGHFRLGHVWTYLLFTLDLVFVSILVKLTAFFRYPDLSRAYQEYATFIDPVIFLGGFLLLFTALTRHSERQADRFAATYVGSDCFFHALERLQDFLGKPLRKMPWWLETHPDFDGRLEEIRHWNGKVESLLHNARSIRVVLVLIALLSVLLIWPNARIVWNMSQAAQALENGQFQRSQAILQALNITLGRHPKIIELEGQLGWRSGEWLRTLALAAEGAWATDRLLPESEVFHHPVSPEIAFELKIVQFLLQSLDLGRVHGIPLFNQCFNLIQAVLSHS